MGQLAAAIALGVTLFIATNIDDIFVLLAFFASSRVRTRDIVIGQYLGIAALVLASLAAALIALVIPAGYIGLLGLVPIALGVKGLYDLWRGDNDDDDEAPQFGARSKVLTVAAVTIANGGDNIGVYTPVFAVQSFFETTVVVLVFLFMTAVWCAFAHWLVHHPRLGAPLRRYAHRALPFVLIGLGVVIVLEASTSGR